MGDIRAFALQPLRASAWLTVAVPMVLVIAITLLAPQQRALPTLAWLATPTFVCLLLIALLLVLRRRRIELSGRELRVAATFYTRRVLVDELSLKDARVIDLAEHIESKPTVKLNGYGSIGFKAGYYLLRNRSRAFCLLTGFERVLVLPQRDGKCILLSPEQPQALLDALRDVAASATPR